MNTFNREQEDKETEVIPVGGGRFSFQDFTRKLLAVLIGDLIVAFGIVFFLRSNQMISGGLTGLALLMEYLTGIRLSILVLLLNAPTFILSLFFLRKDFAFFSALSVLILSFYISIFERLDPQLLQLTDDVFLACIFGGVINGVGAGITFRNGTSTGGLDIIAAIFKKYFNISVGNVLMAINLFIISASGLIYSIDRALYTLIALFLTYTIIDRIQMGIGRQKQVFIVSKKYLDITDAVHGEIQRGVTYLKGEGSFKGQEFKILYVICTSRELAKLRRMVKEIDPLAFVTVSETTEIMGRGFREIEL